MVFPRPISSASMVLVPWDQENLSQFSPSSWYGCSFPPFTPKYSGCSSSFFRRWDFLGASDRFDSRSSFCFCFLLNNRTTPQILYTLYSKCIIQLLCQHHTRLVSEIKYFLSMGHVCGTLFRLTSTNRILLYRNWVEHQKRFCLIGQDFKTAATSDFLCAREMLLPAYLTDPVDTILQTECTVKFVQSVCKLYTGGNKGGWV